RHMLFYFQAEDGLRVRTVTGLQTCPLPISVFHLRLEPLPLIPELLEDRGRAVGEGERAGEDLDHGPAAGHPDRLRFLSPRGRLKIGRASCRERAGASGATVRGKTKETGQRR